LTELLPRLLPRLFPRLFPRPKPYGNCCICSMVLAIFGGRLLAAGAAATAAVAAAAVLPVPTVEGGVNCCICIKIFSDVRSGFMYALFQVDIGRDAAAIAFM